MNNMEPRIDRIRRLEIYKQSMQEHIEEHKDDPIKVIFYEKEIDWADRKLEELNAPSRPDY